MRKTLGHAPQTPSDGKSTMRTKAMDLVATKPILPKRGTVPVCTSEFVKKIGVEAGAFKS